MSQTSRTIDNLEARTMYADLPSDAAALRARYRAEGFTGCSGPYPDAPDFGYAECGAMCGTCPKHHGR